MRLAEAVLLVALVAGCRGATQVAAPSPVPDASLKVLAVTTRDGVVIKAERLSGAHQVEGVIEWTPTTDWYQSFDLGIWWFSATDWEWLMIPAAGRMSWGVWRSEAASGDGVLGVIRFEHTPTIERLSVWVDGRLAEAEIRDKREDRVEAGADGLVPAPGTHGTRGLSGARWFLHVLASD